MKISTKKILAGILIFIVSLALPAFVSCGGDYDNKNIAIDTSLDDYGISAGETTTEERLYPNLDAVDFGGYEFTVLTRSASAAYPDWAEWDHRDISAEEMNGDVINDAVYVRNKKIEEKYNITIKEIVIDESNWTVFPTKVRQSVSAGDDLYDIAVPHIFESTGLAQDGNFIDLFKVTNLDLKQPWWNQNCVRDLSIINKLFVIQGDLLIMDNDAMEAMIFNKSVQKDNALESPYDIVKKGEWTFEKLIEMSKGIAKDLNGDGKMYIKDDLFGYILQCDTAASFIVSGGEKIAGKDENDYPIITFGTERCYRITDYLSEMLSDTENSVNLHSYEGQFPIYDEQVKMMEENRALFSWIRMRMVERLRGMEMDFGIIPLPKLDKNQEKYITSTNTFTGAGVSIPRTATNLERTGMILEDLCAESRYTLQPAYYEINLNGKYIRDNDSYEMLDIILENTAYDIGHIYNFGGYMTTYLEYYGRSKKVEWVSGFEKSIIKMEKDIEKIVELYEKLDD